MGKGWVAGRCLYLRPVRLWLAFSEVQESSQPGKEGCRGCVAPCLPLGFLAPFSGQALVVLALGLILDPVERLSAVLASHATQILSGGRLPISSRSVHATPPMPSLRPIISQCRRADAVDV